MKRRFVTLSLLIAALVCGPVTGFAADVPAPFVITSPDRPDTSEVGANDKLSQDLQWDRAQQRLLLKVVYALDPSSDRWLPADQRSYTLEFPSVRCDESTHTLYASTRSGDRIVLGALHGGFGGPRVRLRRNVELIAHRHDMHLEASLVVH